MGHPVVVPLSMYSTIYIDIQDWKNFSGKYNLERKSIHNNKSFLYIPILHKALLSMLMLTKGLPCKVPRKPIVNDEIDGKFKLINWFSVISGCYSF